MRTTSMIVIVAAAAAALAGCAADPDYDALNEGTAPTPDPGPKVWPQGLHVVGNHIEDSAGKTITLHGVNRSGTEYRCVQNNAYFDGPSSDASVLAIASWPGVNTVRVPLNESCWLGINGAPEKVSGDYYKTAIYNYVQRLHKHGLIPIIELHWVGPGTAIANRQQAMPGDHTAALWADVARTFLDDDGVVLEPYNEPYPDGNKDSAAAWACWRDGCTSNQYSNTNPATLVGTYQAAGMQSLVDAIRATSSTHIILLGGVQFSNALTQWLAYKPTDPIGQLGAAWHLYNNNPCVTAACWDDAPAAVAASVPVVATEIGEYDCMSTFITPLMQWLDGHSLGYLAWSWNAFGVCRPKTMTAAGNPLSLVADYTTGTPNGTYAQAFHDHVAGL